MPLGDHVPCVQTSVEVELTRTHKGCISEKESSRVLCPVEEVEDLLGHDRPGAVYDVLEVVQEVPWLNQSWDMQIA